MVVLDVEDFIVCCSMRTLYESRERNNSHRRVGRRVELSELAPRTGVEFVPRSFVVSYITSFRSWY